MMSLLVFLHTLFIFQKRVTKKFFKQKCSTLSDVFHRRGEKFFLHTPKAGKNKFVRSRGFKKLPFKVGHKTHKMVFDISSNLKIHKSFNLI